MQNASTLITFLVIGIAIIALLVMVLRRKATPETLKPDAGPGPRTGPFVVNDSENLSAQDVLDVRFDQRLNGYDVDQVDLFMDRVVQRIAQLEAQLASATGHNESDETGTTR